MVIRKVYEDGNTQLMACDDCGTLLWFALKGSNVLGVFSGVFSVNANVTPALHIWVHRKQSWLELDDKTPQFDDHVSHADWRSAWSESSLLRVEEDRSTNQGNQNA